MNHFASNHWAANHWASNHFAGAAIVEEERPAGGDDYGRRVYIPGTLAERQRLKKLEDDYRKVLEAKEHAEKVLQAKQEKVKELEKPKEIKAPSLDEELAYLLRQQILQELLIEIAEQQALLISINEEEDNLIIMLMLLD